LQKNLINSNKLVQKMMLKKLKI